MSDALDKAASQYLLVPAYLRREMRAELQRRAEALAISAKGISPTGDARVTEALLRLVETVEGRVEDQ